MLLRPVIEHRHRMIVILHRPDDVDRRFVLAQFIQRAHQPRDRGLGRRIGRVPGRAAGGEPQPERRLLGDGHHVNFALVVGQRANPAALVEQEAGVGEDARLVIDEPSRAVAAAFLLVAGGDKQHVAIEEDARALDREHRHQLDHAGALVVDRAAAPYFAVLDEARERRHLPFLGIGRDHVHVAQQNDRLGMLADAAQAGGDDTAAFLRLPGGGGNAVGKKFFLEHPRRVAFVAGRIGRVELDVLRQQVGRFLRDAVPIDRLRRRRLRRADGLRGQDVGRRRRRCGEGGAAKRQRRQQVCGGNCAGHRRPRLKISITP